MPPDHSCMKYLFWNILDICINFILWREILVALTEAVNFWGNFSSGMLSLGSPAGSPAGSVAGLAILGYLSCLILSIGAHITGDNQDVRQVDSSPCDSFSAQDWSYARWPCYSLSASGLNFGYSALHMALTPIGNKPWAQVLYIIKVSYLLGRFHIK